MTKEEIDFLMQELANVILKIGSITNQTDQMLQYFTEYPKFIEKVWQKGYKEGIKEGQKQKSSVIIKKLIDEN